MWTIIIDCGKQLTIHSKVREKVDDYFKVYDIIEVEFDQYKLKLISNDSPSLTGELEIVLNCKQILQYHFEVEEPETI